MYFANWLVASQIHNVKAANFGKNTSLVLKWTRRVFCVNKLTKRRSPVVDGHSAGENHVWQFRSGPSWDIERSRRTATLQEKWNNLLWPEWQQNMQNYRDAPALLEKKTDADMNGARNTSRCKGSCTRYKTKTGFCSQSATEFKQNISGAKTVRSSVWPFFPWSRPIKSHCCSLYWVRVTKIVLLAVHFQQASNFQVCIDRKGTAWLEFALAKVWFSGCCCGTQDMKTQFSLADWAGDHQPNSRNTRDGLPQGGQSLGPNSSAEFRNCWTEFRKAVGLPYTYMYDFQRGIFVNTLCGLVNGGRHNGNKFLSICHLGSRTLACSHHWRKWFYFCSRTKFIPIIVLSTLLGFQDTFSFSLRQNNVHSIDDNWLSGICIVQNVYNWIHIYCRHISCIDTWIILLNMHIWTVCTIEGVYLSGSVHLLLHTRTSSNFLQIFQQGGGGHIW